MVLTDVVFLPKLDAQICFDFFCSCKLLIFSKFFSVSLEKHFRRVLWEPIKEITFSVQNGIFQFPFTEQKWI